MVLKSCMNPLHGDSKLVSNKEMTEGSTQEQKQIQVWYMLVYLQGCFGVVWSVFLVFEVGSSKIGLDELVLK